MRMSGWVKECSGLVEGVGVRDGGWLCECCNLYDFRRPGPIDKFIGDCARAATADGNIRLSGIPILLLYVTFIPCPQPLIHISPLFPPSCRWPPPAPIMGFWGAPVALPRAALHAAETVLAILLPAAVLPF